MPLILLLNKSGSGRRASPKIKYKEKVIMINKEQAMDMTKDAIQIELAKLGKTISDSKKKNTNKDGLVKMLLTIQDHAPKGETAQKNVDQKNAETESIINVDEPKNIDEMFQGEVVNLDDVRNEKNGKKPKSSSRPDYDVLYNQFKTSLSECGVNIFANRTNRLGEMKALTHVKGMQWVVIITKSGFRFELYMQDDEKGINELYLAMKKDGQDSTKIVGPTGKSTRHKICVTYDGHDAQKHAHLFNVFYNHLMVGIKNLYPLPKSVTKTA